MAATATAIAIPVTKDTIMFFSLSFCSVRLFQSCLGTTSVGRVNVEFARGLQIAIAPNVVR
jgi:hypothetical protein